MNEKVLKPETFYVGEVYSASIPLTSKSGAVTVSAVSNNLYADASTSDILSTYSSGAIDYDGNVITTPLIGKNGATSILPGKYTYFIFITYNGGLIVALTKQLEFLEVVGG